MLQLSNIKENNSNGNPPISICMDTTGKICPLADILSFIKRVATANEITAIKHKEDPYKFNPIVIFGYKITQDPKKPIMIPIILKR